MKKLAKIAALALGAGLVSQVVHAQNSPGSLMLGFSDNDGSPTTYNDYIINLGSVSSVVSAAQASPNLTVDLSADFSLSTFNTAFAGDSSALNNVAVGVVAGDIETSGQSLYLTVLGGSGAPSAIPGTGSIINSAGDIAEGLSAGLLLSANSQSFSTLVAVDPYTAGTASAGNDIADKTGINPLNTLTGGVVSEDLYFDPRGNGGTGPATGWVQVGTFNINLAAPTDLVTFTATSVPEPSTYALMGGAGLMVLVFRNQLRRKNA